MNCQIDIETSLQQLSVEEAEILRYLGYRGQEINGKLYDDIKRCKRIILEKSVPRYVCRCFELNRTADGIQLRGTALTLTGNDIRKLLDGASEAVVMAATIGIEAERTIRYYQRVSVSDGLIMDAAATAIIEAVCDAVEDGMRKALPITRRFSCGYGDLPIGLQRQMLSVLSAQKAIGLYCNASNIMIPRKSVTAVIGVGGDVDGHTQRGCAACSLNCVGGCDLRR